MQKFALLGTDDIYPRSMNTILGACLISKGIPKEDIFVNDTPFGHSKWPKILSDVVALGTDDKKVGIIPTSNGDANIGFLFPILKDCLHRRGGDLTGVSDSSLPSPAP